MDRQTFRDCFKQWLAYKPNKRKDWPTLEDIYFQELSRFTQVQLTEALGRLLTKNQFFPDIAEITKEVYAFSPQKSDGIVAKRGDRERELNDLTIMADRMLEHKLGVEFHGMYLEGKPLEVTMPEDAPVWMEKLVDAAIKRFYSTEEQTYMRGTLGKWVIDEYSGAGRSAA
jgi:hypothetical protein